MVAPFSIGPGISMGGGITITPAGGPPSAYGSGLLNGTSQYLTVPKDAAFDYGNGDFTVETWINLSNATQPAYAGIYTYRGPSNQSYSLLVDFDASGTGIRVTIAGGSVSFGAHGQSANTWWYLAVSRASGSVRVFVNGVQLGSTATMTDYIFEESDYSVYLGTNPAAGGFTYIMSGKLTNIRAVKGTAVYTSNFTPPTTNLTAISGTSLLLNMTSAGTFLTDDSTNAFTVTNVGAATWSSSTPY